MVVGQQFNMKIKKIDTKFKIYSENSLEDYRASSFYEKEPETVAWINDFTEGSIFFDVGANIGIYSLYASIYKKCKTYAFEPYYKNYLRLIENVKLNNQIENCLPFLTGLHNSNKIEQLFISDERSSSSGHQIGNNIDENGIDFNALEKYPLITFSMDDFIRIFNLKSPNYIKIDVDGCENEIIKGMNKTLKDSELYSICIELNMNNFSKADFINYFKELGFSTQNRYNALTNNSKFRRQKKGNFDCENIIFTRK